MEGSFAVNDSRRSLHAANLPRKSNSAKKVRRREVVTGTFYDLSKCYADDATDSGA